MLSDIPLYATIPVKDLQKSMDFYGRTLGMDIIDEDENGVWYRAGSTRFAVYETDRAGAAKAPVAIWLVHQPERLVEALKARGVKFETSTSSKHKTAKKQVLLEQGGYKVALFKDPSGNIICIAGHK